MIRSKRKKERGRGDGKEEEEGRGNHREEGYKNTLCKKVTRVLLVSFVDVVFDHFIEVCRSG